MAPASEENAFKSLEEINSDNAEQNIMSSFTGLVSMNERGSDARLCQYCQLKCTTNNG